MKHMKALLVGAGVMGRLWARNLRDCPDVALAAWVDIRPEAAAEAAEALDLGKVFIGPDLGEAIATSRPDFVVDVSPPDTHRDVTVQALRLGLPVLGEKPMAASMDHAREMVATSERTGTLFMVSQSRRFDANLHALRRLITDYTGPLGILNADFYAAEHFGGFRATMDSPLLVDMAIHHFDAARFLTGAEPVAVYCDEFNPPWSWYDGNACATAIFEMTGGLRFTYRGSRCGEGCHTTWDAAWRAIGPRGTAVWDGENAPVAEVVAAPTVPVARFDRVVAAVDRQMQTGIAGTLRAFLNALKAGDTPPCECHDNIKSLAMVHAAIESAASGRRVPVSV